MGPAARLERNLDRREDRESELRAPVAEKEVAQWNPLLPLEIAAADDGVQRQERRREIRGGMGAGEQTADRGAFAKDVRARCVSGRGEDTIGDRGRVR